MSSEEPRAHRGRKAERRLRRKKEGCGLAFSLRLETGRQDVLLQLIASERRLLAVLLFPFCRNEKDAWNRKDWTRALGRRGPGREEHRTTDGMMERNSLYF